MKNQIIIQTIKTPNMKNIAVSGRTRCRKEEEEESVRGARSLQCSINVRSNQPKARRIENRPANPKASDPRPSGSFSGFPRFSNIYETPFCHFVCALHLPNRPRTAATPRAAMVNSLQASMLSIGDSGYWLLLCSNTPTRTSLTGGGGRKKRRVWTREGPQEPTARRNPRRRAGYKTLPRTTNLSDTRVLERARLTACIFIFMNRRAADRGGTENKALGTQTVDAGIDNGNIPPRPLT